MNLEQKPDLPAALRRFAEWYGNGITGRFPLAAAEAFVDWTQRGSAGRN